MAHVRRGGAVTGTCDIVMPIKLGGRTWQVHGSMRSTRPALGSEDAVNVGSVPWRARSDVVEAGAQKLGTLVFSLVCTWC